MINATSLFYGRAEALAGVPVETFWRQATFTAWPWRSSVFAFPFLKLVVGFVNGVKQ